MMKRTKGRMGLCLGLVCLLLAFIWGNSLMPASVSGAFSQWVKDLLAHIFPGLSSGDPEQSHHLLRKLAHFSEFAALGVCLGWLCGMQGWHRLLPLGLGCAAACVDEMIQLFSPGRHAGIADVAIDTSGVLTGMILLAAGYAILRKVKQPGGKK